jgi:hypothetical protein
VKKFILLILLLLTSFAAAVELDGRIVILLVSEHRSGDAQMESVKEELLKVRDQLGYSKEDMPIVFMGFKDSDTEKTYFDRLGFQEFDSPVLCVAEWGNPARFGPKQVVDYAIARGANPENVDYIVGEYLKATGKSVDADNPVIPVPSPAGVLEIVTTRFEASGKPLYMTNVGVRIKNSDDHTLRDITIRFYNKLQQEDDWRLMGEKTLKKLPSGYFGTRDIVGDTKKFQLTDENNNAVRCFYRIEVEQGGKTIFEEGEFVPSEGPVGIRAFLESRETL